MEQIIIGLLTLLSALLSLYIKSLRRMVSNDVVHILERIEAKLNVLDTIKIQLETMDKKIDKMQERLDSISDKLTEIKTELK